MKESIDFGMHVQKLGYVRKFEADMFWPDGVDLMFAKRRSVETTFQKLALRHRKLSSLNWGSQTILFDFRFIVPFFLLVAS